MEVKIEKQPKSQLKLHIHVENTAVKEAYEKVLEEAVQTTEIEGFRKGKAPKERVAEKVGISKLHGEVINELLQKYYIAAIKENHITPITNPKIEIKEFDIEKDFEFVATTAVKPDVKIKEFKKDLKNLYSEKVNKAKKDNEERLKKGEKLEEVHVHMSPNEVIETLISKSEVEIPELLIEEEANRMIARLVDQAQTVGLSLEEYLKAQNKTSDQLRKDYETLAERNIAAEFILGHLVNEEKIEVTDSEVENTIKAAGVQKAVDKMNDPMEKLYIKAILQKNKLITKLMEEAESHEK